MKLVFSLGPNPKLSFAEVRRYLRARDIPFEQAETKNQPELHNPFIILDVPVLDAQKVQYELGGTTKIGRVLAEAPLSRFVDKDLEAELSTVAGDFFEDGNFRLGISIYPSSQNQLSSINWRDLSEYIGLNLSNHIERLSTVKVSYKTANDARHPSDAVIRPSEAERWGLSEENSGIMVMLGKDKGYIARTAAIFSHKEEARMADSANRPSGWSYGMRPTLAKIMVNLSGARPGYTLLDPFCGVGYVLSAAVMNYVNVVGSDIDSEASNAANQNLQKLVSSTRKGISCRVRDCDVKDLSSFVDDTSIDAIATEPYLGPQYTQRPSHQEATRTIQDLYHLYDGALREFNRVLKNNRDVAMIFPRIRNSSRDVNIDVPRLAGKQGFTASKPILHGGSFQVVMREIYVLHKNGEITI